ncbi:hypothetical protein U9R90_18145 [Streptomyces sp. E11-3]|uniref:hypothetical protein n=1 Tax=Streptomyces sp. E11-3 TaxID=3110112 RepID=UPI0039812A54
MTRVPASTNTVARLRHALAATALAALVLTGCGSEGVGDGEPLGKPGGSGAATARATPPSTEQAAFMAMLDKFARPCPLADETGPGPVGKKPTAPEERDSLAPGETPPTDPIEPGAPTGPEAELNDRDWCASVRHEQRIVQALQAVAEPTPAKVRKVLNGLGYIDERIHGLKQDGKATRFYLDLREHGGRLCEEGSAAGPETDVVACIAPATGAFTVEMVEMTEE